MEAEVEEAEEEEEVAEEVAQRLVEQPQEEEEMRNSWGRNHLPSAEIGRMSTDSCQIFRDTCP